MPFVCRVARFNVWMRYGARRKRETPEKKSGARQYLFRSTYVAVMLHYCCNAEWGFNETEATVGGYPPFRCQG